MHWMTSFDQRLHAWNDFLWPTTSCIGWLPLTYDFRRPYPPNWLSWRLYRQESSLIIAHSSNNCWLSWGSDNQPSHELEGFFFTNYALLLEHSLHTQENHLYNLKTTLGTCLEAWAIVHFLFIWDKPAALLTSNTGMASDMDGMFLLGLNESSSKAWMVASARWNVWGLAESQLSRN